MADYFRIGPPWGILNFIKDPTFNFPVASFNDAWETPNGSSITTNATCHPSLMQSNSAQIITAASSIVGDHLFRASVPVPTVGYFVFECWVQALNGSANRHVRPYIFASGPNAFGELMASGAIPVVGSWTRIVTVANLATTTTADTRSVWAVVANASAPSGAFTMRVAHPRLSIVPMPTDMVGSFYVGTKWYTQRNNVVWLGVQHSSVNAREPADPQFDFLQPCGQAVEIGSMMIPGEVDTGQDLIQQTYNQQVSERGGRLLFEAFPNRSWNIPFIMSAPSNVRDLGEQLMRTIGQVLRPSYVADFRPDGASYVTRFDIQGGRLLNQRDLRYHRGLIYRGTVELTTKPFGYTPTWMIMASLSAPFLGPSPTPFKLEGASMVGDVPAPLRISMMSNIETINNSNVGGFLTVQNLLPSGLAFALSPLTKVNGTVNGSFGRFAMMTASANTFAVTAGDMSRGTVIAAFSISSAQQRGLGRAARVFLNAGGFDDLRFCSASLPVVLRIQASTGKALYVTIPAASQGNIATSWSGLFDCGVINFETGDNIQLSRTFTISPATTLAAVASSGSAMMSFNSVLMVPADVETSRVYMMASHNISGGLFGVDDTNAYVHTVDSEDSVPRIFWSVYGITFNQPSNRIYPNDQAIRGDYSFEAASNMNFGAIPMYYQPSMQSGFLGHPTRYASFWLTYKPHWLFVR